MSGNLHGNYLYYLTNIISLKVCMFVLLHLQVKTMEGIKMIGTDRSRLWSGIIHRPYLIPWKSGKSASKSINKTVKILKNTVLLLVSKYFFL